MSVQKFAWQLNWLRRFNTYDYLATVILNMACTQTCSAEVFGIITRFKIRIYLSKTYFESYESLYTGLETSWKFYSVVPWKQSFFFIWMFIGSLISKFAKIEWHERETKWKVRNVNKTSLCYINKTLLHPRLRTFQCHKQTINKYMNIVKWFTTKDSLMTSVRTGVGEKSNISIQKIVPCSSPLFIFPLFPKYTCLPAVVLP